MVKEIQLKVKLQEETKANILEIKAAQFLKIPKSNITAIKVLRKSIDARNPKIYFVYKVAIYISEPAPEKSKYQFNYKDVSSKPEVHIVGFGPAGMYAALRCIELGYKPVVLERGKDVRARRRDLREINQFHNVIEVRVL